MLGHDHVPAAVFCGARSARFAYFRDGSDRQIWVLPCARLLRATARRLASDLDHQGNAERSKDKQKYGPEPHTVAHRPYREAEINDPKQRELSDSKAFALWGHGARFARSGAPTQARS